MWDGMLPAQTRRLCGAPLRLPLNAGARVDLFNHLKRRAKGHLILARTLARKCYRLHRLKAGTATS